MVKTPSFVWINPSNPPWISPSPDNCAVVIDRVGKGVRRVRRIDGRIRVASLEEAVVTPLEAVYQPTTWPLSLSPSTLVLFGANPGTTGKE